MRYADATIALESLAPGESKLLDCGVPIYRQRSGLYNIGFEGCNLDVHNAAEAVIIEAKRIEKVRGDDRSENEK
jgi:hypothetical protein